MLPSPITPAPAIHNDPTAKQNSEQELQALVASLEKMFAALIPQIVQFLLKLITGGLLGGQTSQEAIATFEKLFGNLLKLWGIVNPNVLISDVVDIPAIIENWVANELVPLGLVVPETELRTIIGILISPFGGGTVSDNTPAAINELVWAFSEPMRILGNFTTHVEHSFTDALARIAGLEAKLNALSLATNSGGTLNGGSDDCATTSLLDMVLNIISPTGWGAWTSATTAAALYHNSPLTIRHGAGFKVKNKRIGQTRLVICSDAAMDNYAALHLETQWSGFAYHDTVSVVSGTSPTDVQVQTTLVKDIPSESFWEIRYEPYDETSDTSNTFHVFMNGDEVVPLRWQDNGNLVLHDATNDLRVGLLLNGLNNSTRRGFDVTDFTFYDWLAAAPQ